MWLRKSIGCPERRQGCPRAALAAAAVTIAACRQQAPNPPEAPRCEPDTRQPQFTAPSQVEPAESVVSVELGADTRFIARRLEAQVPVNLAQGQQRVLFAGRVTYAVRRGPLSVGLVNDRLMVTTKVGVDVSICKPVGGLCPVYASCAPKLTVMASLPLLLDSQYGLGESAVVSQLDRGCRLVGFDVSGEVKRRADQQAHGVKVRIDRARPDIAHWVRRGWKQLPRQLSLGPLGCLRIEPTRVQQSTPRLLKDDVSTALIIEGHLGLETTCDTSESQPDDPPPLTLTNDTPETRIRLPLAQPWAGLGPRVVRAASAAAAPEALTVKQATVRGALLDGKPVVILRLEVEGACGAAWMSARPWYDSESNAVRFKNLLPVLEPGSGLSPGQLAVLARRIADSFELPLTIDPRQTIGVIDRLIEQSLSSVDEVAVSVELEPAEVRTLVGPDALVAIVGLDGRISVQPK